MQKQLSERQEREREFYASYAQQHRDEDVNFDPVLGHESRPWNSYWRLYEAVGSLYRDGSQRLLDFGCGMGNASMLYAKIGYQVSGFDVCEENLEECRRKAQRYGFEDRTDFSIQAAEDLEYPDESFDVVAGLDILHHVEVGPALRQAYRVLKPGGVAVFREFVEVPVFDTLRNSPVGTWLVSNEASLQDHRTEDEHKLTRDQMEIVTHVFPNAEIIRFNLLSRFRRFFPFAHSKPGRPSKVERLDQVVFRTMPFTQRLGGDVVMMLRK